MKGGYLTKKLSIEKEYLEDDLTTITRINELAKILAYPHQVNLFNFRSLSIPILLLFLKFDTFPIQTGTEA